MGVLGYRSIDLSAAVLGVLMAAEIAILGVFDVAVLAAKGAAALPLASFAPQTVFAPGFAVTLMFGFTGFESAALYGEEAERPTRSIPRATLAAVLLIGGFYLATAWIAIGAVGAEQAKAQAAAQGGQFMFGLMARYTRPELATLMGVLVCTSMLASYLAIHNAATRYLFALAREKLLPDRLGRFHPERYAPSNASFATTGITVAAVGAVALSGAEPYRTAIPVLVGLATVGVIALQAFAGVAIVAYFLARPATQLWRTRVAPAVGAVGLLAATGLVIANFGLLTTSPLQLVQVLPFAYPLAAVAGAGFGLWLKRRRPAVYAALASADLRADSARAPAAMTAGVTYDAPHAIVGAGPCGLLAARAFKLATIPYDQFERHTGVGGIWDIENPGTSMYEAAHFISSKYTSGFFGLPMPDHYPDYPDYRQLHAYIQDFADAYGLTPGVTFSTAVERAEPLGEGAKDGWRVRLSTGETRHYRGLVCAPGVTWHPNRPDYPGLGTFAGDVRHTVEYRSADMLRGRRVLIMGAGNSGVDIACEAARNADAAFLSVRRGYRFVPKHIFGVPTDVFVSGRVRPPKGVVLPDDPSEMLDALVGDLTRYGLPKPDHKAFESHPIMNSQILHHLAHGDIKAKGAVTRFTPMGAVFADGSEETFDLVLFATGYDYKLPFLDEGLFTWKQGHPELYLNIFHRTLAGLSVVGFVEFASAGYQRFDEMAQMTAMDAFIRASGHGLDDWTRKKREDRPDLRGAMTYVDSPRHANYVDVSIYRRVLSQVRERFGWPDPEDALYAPMKARRLEPRT